MEKVGGYCSNFTCLLVVIVVNSVVIKIMFEIRKSIRIKEKKKPFLVDYIAHRSVPHDAMRKWKTRHTYIKWEVLYQGMEFGKRATRGCVSTSVRGFVGGKPFLANVRMECELQVSIYIRIA